MLNRILWSAVILAGFSFASDSASADFMLTANDAGSQASIVAGVTTEDFNAIPAGRYTSRVTAVGTITSPGFQVVPRDSYGGAGTTGNYFSIGAQSGSTTATLALNGAQAYFGFWWSAADAQNQITFLSGGRVVAQFNAATALGALDDTYKTNPNGGDPGEKFAYLNFFGTGGSTFDQIIFANAGTGTGFESDNWSVKATQVPPPYPGHLLAGISSVPEPSSLALTASGLLAGIALLRRRRRVR